MLGELTCICGDTAGCRVVGGVEVRRGLRSWPPGDNYRLSWVPCLAEDGQGIVVCGALEGLAIDGKNLIALLNGPFLGGQPIGKHTMNLHRAGVVRIQPVAHAFATG